MPEPADVTPSAESDAQTFQRAERTARRLSLAAKTWLVSGLLLLVIGIIVGRTLVSRDTRDERDLSDLASQTFEALQATKIAYSLNHNKAQTETKPNRPTPPSEGKNTAHPQDSTSSATDRLEDAAIRKWRELATAHPDYAAPWRKLGLTLSLFHRPGAMEAFRHIAVLSDKAPGQPASEERNPSKSRRRQQVTEQTVLLSHAQEFALWQAVYGSEPLDSKRASEWKTKIQQLNLGWFENIALAQLYNRTGQKAQAQQAADAAIASAEQIYIITGSEMMFALFGLLVLFLYGTYHLGEWLQRRSLAAQGIGPRIPPMPPAYMLHAQARQAPWRFSYWSRGMAFIIYMAAFLLIALPVRLIHPWIASWSMEAVVRLSAVLQIVLYIPIVAITLVLLRRLVAAETPGGVRPSWHEMLQGIGLFSRRPLEDIGAGVFAYTMAFPVFLAITLLSAWIFRSFHTPINPVEIEMMVSQSRLDQALMLLQAAVAAPIVEEMMFRGLLFPALKERWGLIGGVLISSACFALVHPNLPSGFLPLWTLGIAFALTFQRRESLLSNIVMHGLHNGFVTITLFALFAK